MPILLSDKKLSANTPCQQKCVPRESDHAITHAPRDTLQEHLSLVPPDRLARRVCMSTGRGNSVLALFDISACPFHRPPATPRYIPHAHTHSPQPCIPFNTSSLPHPQPTITTPGVCDDAVDLHRIQCNILQNTKIS